MKQKKQCHCGKDGHALRSVNCPVHCDENKTVTVNQVKAVIKGLWEAHEDETEGDYEERAGWKAYNQGLDLAIFRLERLLRQRPIVA